MINADRACVLRQQAGRGSDADEPLEGAIRELIVPAVPYPRDAKRGQRDGLGDVGRRVRVCLRLRCAAVAAGRLAVLVTKCAGERRLSREAGAARHALDRQIAVQKVHRGTMQAQAAPRLVDGLAEQAAVDTVEVVRRKAGDACERLEIERVVQVTGEMVYDSLDALGVVAGIGGHGERLAHLP